MDGPGLCSAAAAPLGSAVWQLLRRLRNVVQTRGFYNAVAALGCSVGARSAMLANAPRRIKPKHRALVLALHPYSPDGRYERPLPAMQTPSLRAPTHAPAASSPWAGRINVTHTCGRTIWPAG